MNIILYRVQRRGHGAIVRVTASEWIQMRSLVAPDTVNSHCYYVLFCFFPGRYSHKTDLNNRDHQSFLLSIVTAAHFYTCSFVGRML